MKNSTKRLQKLKLRWPRDKCSECVRCMFLRTSKVAAAKPSMLAFLFRRRMTTDGSPKSIQLQSIGIIEYAKCIDM